MSCCRNGGVLSAVGRTQRHAQKVVGWHSWLTVDNRWQLNWQCCQPVLALVSDESRILFDFDVLRMPFPNCIRDAFGFSDVYSTNLKGKDSALAIRILFHSSKFQICTYCLLNLMSLEVFELLVQLWNGLYFFWCKIFNNLFLFSLNIRQ